MSESQRLDAAMVSRGLAGGRDKAKRLILDGAVTVNGAVITKPSATVTQDDTVLCAVTERFVSRGGEKLCKVLENTALSVRGCVCGDIGASTGGFTDCLLQFGAEKVFAVDVGHDQLADSLRADPRVVSLEGMDIRNRDRVAAVIPDHSLAVCTVDVSFISLMQIWEAVTALLAENGQVVCLIKPQFEAGRAALGKRGVVKREQDHVRVLQTLLCFWQEQGYGCSYLSWSPVRGGEGNIEYVALLGRGGEHSVGSPETLVKQAFRNV